MPVCKNRECREEFANPLGSLWGKSFSYGEKEIRKLLCQECRNRIQNFVNTKPSDEREWWKLDHRYFCWTCKRIDLSFDNTYQDNKKYCQCRNKHLDGLPYPDDMDDGVYDYGEGW